MSHVTRTLHSTSKGQGHQAALVGCTGRPTWTYSNGHLSICVHVYSVTTCRPGRGHIVAAARDVRKIEILFGFGFLKTEPSKI